MVHLTGSECPKSGMERYSSSLTDIVTRPIIPARLITGMPTWRRAQLWKLRYSHRVLHWRDALIKTTAGQSETRFKIQKTLQSFSVRTSRRLNEQSLSLLRSEHLSVTRAWNSSTGSTTVRFVCAVPARAQLVCGTVACLFILLTTSSSEYPRRGEQSAKLETISTSIRKCWRNSRPNSATLQTFRSLNSFVS